MPALDGLDTIQEADVLRASTSGRPVGVLSPALRAGRYLKNIPQALDVEFPLDGADTHLARGPASSEGTPTPALTSLRLSVDLGETPDPSTAGDLFAYADLSGPRSPPRLVVHWCESTPTPTPTP